MYTCFNPKSCACANKFTFDATDKIGYRRFQLTKNFCEEANTEMKPIRSYAYQFPSHPREENDPRTNFLKWKAEDDRFYAERANKPDKYGTHSL